MALTRISTFYWLKLIGDTLLKAIPSFDRIFAGSSAAADICHPTTHCMMGELMALSSYMGQLAGDVMGAAGMLYLQWWGRDL